MTPTLEERAKEIEETWDGHQNWPMLRQALLRHLREVAAEVRAEMGPKWIRDWSKIEDDEAYLCAAINNKQDGTGIYLSNFYALKGWEVKQRLQGCYCAVKIGWPKTMADLG